jgi:hypothetical protein
MEGTQSDSDLEELAEDRKYLHSDTPKDWGCVRSVIRPDEWLLPAKSANLLRKPYQVYRWVRLKDDNRALWLTPGLWPQGQSHGIFCPSDLKVDGVKQTVYTCEGPWDGMALWEVMRETMAIYPHEDEEDQEPKLTPTSNPAASMLKDATVIAVPSCSVFQKSWARLLKDKDVVLLYDNDHPTKLQNGAVGGMGAWHGMRQVAAILSREDSQPNSLSAIRWSSVDGSGFNSTLKHGYDIRDLLTSAGKTITARIGALSKLLKMIKPIPDDWIPGRSDATKTRGGVNIMTKECNTWGEVVEAGKNCLTWIEGLDRALSVMLASIVSVKAPGDQLWVKVISPPSTGKSTLCEALSVAKDYVHAESTLTGMHSGFKTDKEGLEDHSLIKKCMDKTLVIKDADALLRMPNLSQILSELRDIYDRTSRKHYRHALSRRYDNINMTLILCGTPSLHDLDDSELGQRFVDCRITNEIDEDLEDEIGWQVVNRAYRDMSFEVNGKVETADSPEMVEFKRRVGGYVNYLRKNAKRLLSAVKMDEEHRKMCQHLGKFAAFMRARPSKKQNEEVQRELSSRLSIQSTRLAIALAAVLGKTTVDSEVMRRVRQCALDTSKGRTYNLIRILRDKGMKGVMVHPLSTQMMWDDKELAKYLSFLKKLNVLDQFHPEEIGLSYQIRWRLMPRIAKLWDMIVGQHSED